MDLTASAKTGRFGVSSGAYTALAPHFTHACTHVHDAVPAVRLGEGLGEEEGTPLHFAAVEFPERRLPRHPVLFRSVMRGYVFIRKFHARIKGFTTEAAESERHSRRVSTQDQTDVNPHTAVQQYSSTGRCSAAGQRKVDGIAEKSSRRLV